jgi:hypothetical protein
LTPLSIRREFLGWDRPALPEAARRLAERYGQGGTLDLGRVIVVVPGHRAGRRLQELLAFLAEDENLRLTPPEAVTEGRLPEMLYLPRLPFANELVQDLAWAQALRELPAAKRETIVPHTLADTDARRSLELGKVLRGLHVELAADGLDFAAVQRRGQQLADFNDTERWQALATVQRRYLDLLDAQKLWDIQTARLRAIELRELHTDRDIILLGTVDLNTTLRQMLAQVAARVTAYIIAPETLANHFDAEGCLVPRAWCDALIPLRDDQLDQVDGPAEQADAVSAWLGEVAGRVARDEVAIGVPDESLVPQLQRQLNQYGVQTRWVEGIRLAETAPYRLLAAAVAFAGRRRYDDLAALLRHPDLEEWLQIASASQPRSPVEAVSDRPQATSLPAQLDRFYNACLPSRIRAGSTLANHKDWPDLAPALARIDGWLEEASKSRPLRVWGDILCKILSAIYGHRTLDLKEPADEVLHRTIRRVVDTCARLRSLPEALDTVPVSAADAVQVALGPLASEALPPAANPEAIEILGWLELPLDDSRALVVSSFNEGFVPKSAGSDAFLPDRLRRELGLLHNERRYARDAYATSVLCHAREEFRVLFAQRDTRNDPLQPSRLIFAGSDDVLVRRARQFFGKATRPAVMRRPLLARDGPIPAASLFAVPRPVPCGRRRSHIAVTEFKDYLGDPYRYYLRHVRTLRAVDDSMRELDGMTFGKLLHKVVGAFGRDPRGPRHTDREQDIIPFLIDRLDALARELYGPLQHRPAIQVQIEQARRRLRAFAACQARLVQEGWLIVYVEGNQEDRLAVPFPVDGEAITLVGRIDRIDYCQATRTIRILDYKTGDRGETPERTHRSRDNWIDLQLPLYRHLWRTAGVTVPDSCGVELGYFNLPRKLDDTGIQPARWDAALLANADQVAGDVVRKLRAGFFEPIPGPAPAYRDDFAAICLDNVLGGPALGGDDEGGPA